MPTIPIGLETAWTDDTIAERIGSSSPNSASFNSDGNSRASMTYIVDGFGTDLAQQNPLVAFCQQALGTTKISELFADGSLERSSPMAHPQYRWLYADSISSIRGLGLLRESQEDPSSPLVSWDTASSTSYQLTAPYFAIYSKYEVTVEFGPRPYLSINDPTMLALEAEHPGEYAIIGPDNTYSKDDSTPVTIAGSPFREYMRFTTFTTETSAEYLTLKGGQFQFVSDVTDPPINGTTIPGFFGKTLIPKTTIKMTWFDVPYNFVDPNSTASTNIYQGLGRVNQNWFSGFAPGELLFVGFSNTQKMRNQFDVFDYSLENAADLPNINTILLTDITFNFLYIPIFSYDKDGAIYPATPTGVINSQNLSYVNAGHNLAMSNANKKYYPVVSLDVAPNPLPENWDKTIKKPIYPSYPFELMFNALPYIMAEEPTE
jgi:hypothetical protein